MSLFACAIQLGGGRVPESFRTSIEASPFARDRALRWQNARGFVGASATAGGGAVPSIVHLGSTVAIGVARLDNRDEVSRWCGLAEPPSSDLALAARYLMRDGGARAARLLGDFALVIWDPASLTVLAARDAFGVRKLFRTDERSGLVTFGSHASLLARDDKYDVAYLLERMTQRSSAASRTAFSDVSAVPSAVVLHIRRGASHLTTYWSARDAQESFTPPTSPADQIETFRSLLFDGVRLRVADGGNTWSQLSGGMDSSSVVSIAQWLLHRGTISQALAGTVSYTDDLGSGADERAYSDTIAERWDLRNELVPHRSDEAMLLREPPLLDQPDVSYTVAARDLTAARLIRDAGGHVLLTGEGGDALVAGTMFFFADWLVTGRARESLREMVHRAALGHVSFWRLAFENALLPLLPAPLRAMVTPARARAIPPWILRQAARHLAKNESWSADQLYRGRLGFKYVDAAAATIAAIPMSMPLGPQDELIERRHPYLHRPLVELALGLPPEACVRPHQRKWILREAVKGIVPESVRTRVGKGALDGIHAWMLAQGSVRIRRLLRDPILAELGIVAPTTLRAMIANAPTAHACNDDWRSSLSRTLEVEMWLQLRSGRWAADDPQCTSTTHVAVS